MQWGDLMPSSVSVRIPSYGYTYTGWTCRNCNTSTATVVIVKDHEWENSDGYLIHSMGYEYHCDVCGDTWYSYSAENLGKPKPKKD